VEDLGQRRRSFGMLAVARTGDAVDVLESIVEAALDIVFKLAG